MGSIPQIGVYEPQVSPRASLDIPMRSPEGATFGFEALQRSGQELMHVERQKREEQAIVSANSDLMSTRSDWLTQLEQRKQSAEPGAPNFTPQVLDDFDKDAAARIKNAQTPTAKKYLQERLGEVRFGLQQEALHFESGAIVKQKTDALSQSVDSARTAADFRPQDFQSIVTDQKTAIANSGLPREQQIEMAQRAQNAIADAAVNGQIRRDPYAALKELDNEKSTAPGVSALDFHDRLRLRTEAETEIRRREAEARERMAAAREDLNERVQDSQAAYLAGIPVPNPPSKSEFLSVYPKDRQEQAEKHYAAFTDMQRVGADLQAVTRMTPAEQDKLLEERRPTQVSGAADAMRSYSLLTSHVANLQRQLTKDPAAYVETYNPGVKSASDAFSQDPGADTAQAYAQASISAQRTLGVAQPALLTDAQAHAMSARMQLSGNGEDVVNSIAQERQTWGRYWPQALAEASPKLNPAVQVIALGMDPVPASRLASVAALKPEELSKILPSSTREADVKAAVSGKLEDFGSTMIGLAGSEDQLTHLNDAAVKLTMSYVAGGEKLEKAAQRAANEVVLSRYDVRTWRGNSLRLPKGTDADLVIHGLASLHAGVMRDLKVSSGDVRWRTLPDDSGVVLEDAASNRPLSRADGSLVSYSFGQVVQAGVNRNEDARQVNKDLKSPLGEP